uniref:phospholipase A2 n=1 Tax=Brassica oleracea TaxID=3712 RepID=A0A3P6FVU1_BRAOL|nr:unnamed protein product [Brassica oleracea]
MVYGGALSRFAFGLATFLLFAFVHSKEKCSKTCTAKNCNIVGVRYGKFCGIGYFGCPGEKPCDGLDACCMTHDNCVDLKGCFLVIVCMTYVNCHKQFQHCVNRLSRAIKQSNGTKVGFSTKCPYSKVIPTVYNGMDYGIFFSKIAGNIFKPKVPGKAPRVEVNLAQSKADTKDGLGTKVALQTKEGSKKTLNLLMFLLS